MGRGADGDGGSRQFKVLMKLNLFGIWMHARGMYAEEVDFSVLNVKKVWMNERATATKWSVNQVQW